MDKKSAVAPTENHLKEMLSHWREAGIQSFSLSEALQWCATHYPYISPQRFGALLRESAANRKRDRQRVSDLVWQLDKKNFIPYDPAVDPTPGSRDAAAWVIRLALEGRPDVVQGDILDQYCALLATAIEYQKHPNKTSQEIADGLAGLLRADNIEEFLAQVSELGAAEYFRKMYPKGFANHVPNPYSSSTGPEKNFDFTFEAEGVRFNVEVKAFSKAFSVDEEGGAKFFVPEPIKQQLYDVGIEMKATLAPTIGRFLGDANCQLPRRDNDMNVVLLCCTDPDEYADVMESLHGPYGLIRASRAAGNSNLLPNSVISNLSLMTNIDALVVCLTGFLHSGIVNTFRFSRAYKLDGLSLSDPKHAWDFRFTFPCGFWLHCPPAEQLREVSFHKVFNSHLWLLLAYYEQHNKNWQAAVFSLINHKQS